MRGVALIASVMFALWLCRNTKEGQEAYELFAGAGFRRTPPFKSDVIDTSNMGAEEKVTDATPDLIQRLVNLVLESRPDDCLFPIETNSLARFGDSNVYKASFTFVRQDTGFPTGVVIQSVVDAQKGKVLGSKTQVVDAPNNITSYQEGRVAAYAGIQEASMPTRDALESIQNSLR